MAYPNPMTCAGPPRAPVKLMVPMAYTWSCTLDGWLPPSPPSVRANLGRGPCIRTPSRFLRAGAPEWLDVHCGW